MNIFDFLTVPFPFEQVDDGRAAADCVGLPLAGTAVDGRQAEQRKQQRRLHGGTPATDYTAATRTRRSFYWRPPIS